MTLMKECGWLSVARLTKYHSLIYMWKIIKLNKPEQMRHKLTINEDLTIATTPATLLTVSAGFRWRTTTEWNNLSTELRNCNKIQTFKRKLKTHILELREPEQNETLNNTTDSQMDDENPTNRTTSQNNTSNYNADSSTDYTTDSDSSQQGKRTQETGLICL